MLKKNLRSEFLNKISKILALNAFFKKYTEHQKETT